MVDGASATFSEMSLKRSVSFTYFSKSFACSRKHNMFFSTKLGNNPEQRRSQTGEKRRNQTFQPLDREDHLFMLKEEVNQSGRKVKQTEGISVSVILVEISRFAPDKC